MKMVISVYRDFMKPFADMTTISQGSKTPTMPRVARFLLPIVQGLSTSPLEITGQDNGVMRQAKTLMLEKLRQHFPTEQQAMYYACLYLDPLFVTKADDYIDEPLIAVNGKAIIRDRLKELLEEHKQQQQQGRVMLDAQPFSADITQDTPAPGSPTDSIEKALQGTTSLQGVVQEQDTADSIMAEYEMYGSKARDDAKVVVYKTTLRSVKEDAATGLVGDALKEARS